MFWRWLVLQVDAELRLAAAAHGCRVAAEWALAPATVWGVWVARTAAAHYQQPTEQALQVPHGLLLQPGTYILVATVHYGIWNVHLKSSVYFFT